MKRILSVFCFLIGIVSLINVFTADFRFILFAVPLLAAGVWLWKSANKSREQKRLAAVQRIEDQEVEKEPEEEYVFKVAGVTYYTTNIESLGSKNDDYRRRDTTLLKEYDPGDKIFEYIFDNPYQAELVPDPENEYDKNAIKVIINHLIVGHIARTRTSAVKKLMQDPFSVTAEIAGGNRKAIRDDIGSADPDEREAFVSTDKRNYFIRLTIRPE